MMNVSFFVPNAGQFVGREQTVGIVDEDWRIALQELTRRVASALLGIGESITASHQRIVPRDIPLDRNRAQFEASLVRLVWILRGDLKRSPS